MSSGSVSHLLQIKELFYLNNLLIKVSKAAKIILTLKWH